MNTIVRNTLFIIVGLASILCLPAQQLKAENNIISLGICAGIGIIGANCLYSMINPNTTHSISLTDHTKTPVIFSSGAKNSHTQQSTQQDNRADILINYATNTTKKFAQAHSQELTHIGTAALTTTILSGCVSNLCGYSFISGALVPTKITANALELGLKTALYHPTTVLACCGLAALHYKVPGCSSYIKKRLSTCVKTIKDSYTQIIHARQAETDCFICCDAVNNPALMQIPCTNTHPQRVCSDCWQEWVDNRTAGNQPVTCPACNTPIPA